MTSARDRETPGDGPITLINVFEVPAERVEEFFAQWRTIPAPIMAASPGFRDARLHRAVSSEARFQFVNVAHWDSKADLDAALGSDARQAAIRALSEDSEMWFAAYPEVYEVIAELRPGEVRSPVEETNSPGVAHD